MKSTFSLLILMFTSSTCFSGETRQLYRLTNPSEPYKGYLRVIEPGDASVENFETCAGLRMKVDENALVKERGSCEQSRGSGSMWVGNGGMMWDERTNDAFFTDNTMGEMRPMEEINARYMALSEEQRELVKSECFSVISNPKVFTNTTNDLCKKVSSINLN